MTGDAVQALLFAPRAVDVVGLAEGERMFVIPGVPVYSTGFCESCGDWSCGCHRVVPASLPTLDEPCPKCTGKGVGWDRAMPCRRCGGSRRVPKDWHIVVPQWLPMVYEHGWKPRWPELGWRPMPMPPDGEPAERRQVVQWLGHDPVLYPVRTPVVGWPDDVDRFISLDTYGEQGDYDPLFSLCFRNDAGTWTRRNIEADELPQGLRPGDRVVQLRVEKLAEPVVDMPCSECRRFRESGEVLIGRSCMAPGCMDGFLPSGRVPISVPEGQIMEVTDA